MKTLVKCAAFVLLTSLAVTAPAKIITVNIADNTDNSAGHTNLAKAISLLADGDTIQFSIPGAGVHYIQTPGGGYPLITANNVTIDGYSQPGAVPNSNPIHAANNAQIKIVLASTNGNALSMGAAIAAATGFSYNNLGFGSDETAILGFFAGSNALVRGLAIISDSTGTDGSNSGDLKSISFCPDSVEHAGDSLHNCRNWRVSGCWFGVQPENGQIAYMPDGTTVATPTICIASYRTRDNGGANSQYAQPGTIGVASNSPTPRADFNVFVTGYGFDSEGLNYRISGNFWGVLPDGNTSADLSVLNQLGDGFIEIGRDGSNLIIGTDGNGINDADEGNVFGGMAKGGAVYFDLYNSPMTNVIIAGNWFNLGVDGVTRFDNAAPLLDSFEATSTVRFGSDFDGISDALEANRVYNITNDFHKFFDGTGGSLNAGARVSFRGNVTVNNELLPYTYANGANTRLYNFTNYEAPYFDTNSDIIPTVSAQSTAGDIIGRCAPTNGSAYSNIFIDVYELDLEGWSNGIALDIPELTGPTYTNGFPQGKRFLGSFVDNGPYDRDPAVGSFNFNAGPLGLTAGTIVTITANYSADPAGTHNGRTHTSNFSNPTTLRAPLRITSISHSGSNVTINWTGASPPYTLQKKVSLTNAWTNFMTGITGTSGNDTFSTGPAFYRVLGN